jgi:hypothetical protein
MSDASDEYDRRGSGSWVPYEDGWLPGS